MNRQLIKKALKKRKGRTLLIIEFILAFIIVFTLFIFTFKSIENYFRPIGFRYENILDIGAGVLENQEEAQPDSVKEELVNQIANVLKGQPDIESYTMISGFAPFGIPGEVKEVFADDYRSRASIWKADDTFADVMQLQLDAGRWFSNKDNASKNPPVIINRELAARLSLDVGHTLILADKEHQIVGVVRAFYPNNTKRYEGLFIRNTPGDVHFEPDVSFLARTSASDIDARFIIRYHELVGSVVKNQSNKNTFVFSLEELRRREWSGNIVLVLILGIVVGFLIINLLLGLVGVLRQNVVRRTQEIGLRRAVGSTRTGIHRMIIGEMYVLLGFSCLIGCFFTMQFYLFNVFKTTSVHYLLSMVLSLLFLFLMVGLFALHPALKAARIEPAEALHNE